MIRITRRISIVLASISVALLATACGGGGSSATATPRVAPTGTATARASLPPTSTPATSGTVTIAAIAIQSPIDGERLAVPIPVTGVANVSDGALVVAAVDGAGKVLCQRNVPTPGAVGTAGSWKTALAFAPPAADTEVTLRAFTLSAKDGSVQSLVTRRVQVTTTPPNIVIATPACNADVQALTTLNVSGEASVFEAALVVELRDAQGTAIQKQSVKASAGAPERAPWQTSFDLSGVATGTYEIAAYNLSARNGAVENEFANPIRITT